MIDFFYTNRNRFSTELNRLTVILQVFKLYAWAESKTGLDKDNILDSKEIKNIKDYFDNFMSKYRSLLIIEQPNPSNTYVYTRFKVIII